MENKFQGIAQLWAGLAPAQKTVIAFFAAAMVVVVMIIATVASRPDYTVLFANLKAEDAASIVTKLRDTKVPYRVTANGTAIEVPAKDVYNVRLDLAGQGLPQGGSVGFELFDRSSLGMTDFSQKMNYLRALQGELQRTVMSLDQVADARVHIVLPDDSLYTQEEKQASASVVLNLKTPGDLPQEQVQSIVNLVSASVEGLNPNRVTVVDTRGHLLADGSGDDISGAKLTGSQLEARRKMERSIQHDVETMLDSVVGAGKSVVRVNALLSFDQRETTSELYQPAGNGLQGVMTSQETQSEQYGSAPKMASGVPGTSSNMGPGAARPASAGAPGGYVRTQNKAEFEVSKRLEKVAQAPGKLERLNVAVMVDKQVGMDKLDSIRQTVAAAAGADTARGDKVVVEAVDFPKPAQDAKPTLAGKLSSYFNVGRNALAVFLLLGFALFIRGALAKSLTGGASAGTAALPGQGAAGQIAGQDAQAALAGADGGGLAAPAGPQLKLEHSDLGLPLAEAQDVAKQQPEEIASIVRTWLAEDKRAA